MPVRSPSTRDFFRDQGVDPRIVSLDYGDTLQAAAGEQCEEIRRKAMKDDKGQSRLAVEGNAPTRDSGVYCMFGGQTVSGSSAGNGGGREGDCGVGFVRIPWTRAECEAESGRVQNAKPNPAGGAGEGADHEQADCQSCGVVELEK